MPSNSKPLERFSYFPKDVTIAALVDVKSTRLPRKIQQELLGQATRQAGVVPFDWQMSGAEFVMYFGVDTVESALAAQKRLQQANFTVFFWTEEEGIYLAAKVLERLEREGVEVGPMIRVIEGLDGSPELETIEWRDFAKKRKYRN
jgi:hypothetical protein